MREIKFRAWNKKQKIMCYENEDDSACYWDGVFSSNVGLINAIFKQNDPICNAATQNNNYEYMQYTGLKDKNGVEVYEGDILQNDITNSKVIVKFYGTRFMLCNNDKLHDVEMFAFLHRIPTMFEVIGNIYEGEKQ